MLNLNLNKEFEFELMMPFFIVKFEFNIQIKTAPIGAVMRLYESLPTFYGFIIGYKFFEVLFVG